MKKMLAGITGAALIAITPGNAADLGRPIYKAPPPVPAPVRVFSWTGCYIGGNIGWGWGRDTISIPNVAEITGEPELTGVSAPSETADTSGVLGGGQIGCNYQFAPNWVIGIEGDGEAANIKGDATHSDSFTNPLTGAAETVTGTSHRQTDWIASATGRLGLTWDRVMLYAKGGAAWVGAKCSADLRAFENRNQRHATGLDGWRRYRMGLLEQLVCKS
jgi:outer membrane immunogenic protein